MSTACLCTECAWSPKWSRQHVVSTISRSIARLEHKVSTPTFRAWTQCTSYCNCTEFEKDCAWNHHADLCCNPLRWWHMFCIECHGHTQKLNTLYFQRKTWSTLMDVVLKIFRHLSWGTKISTLPALIAPVHTALACSDTICVELLISIEFTSGKTEVCWSEKNTPGLDELEPAVAAGSWAVVVQGP